MCNAVHESFDIRPVSDKEISTDTTQISTTDAGNVVFELGDVDLGEDGLRASMERLNANILPNQNIVAGSIANSAAPILFDEATEDSQNLQNYYGAMVNWDLVDNEVGRMYNDFTIRMQHREFAFNQQLQTARARHQEWKKRNETIVQREHNRARAHLMLG